MQQGYRYDEVENMDIDHYLNLLDEPEEEESQETTIENVFSMF